MTYYLLLTLTLERSDVTVFNLLRVLYEFAAKYVCSWAACSPRSGVSRSRVRACVTHACRVCVVRAWKGRAIVGSSEGHI